MPVICKLRRTSDARFGVWDHVGLIAGFTEQGAEGFARVFAAIRLPDALKLRTRISRWGIILSTSFLLFWVRVICARCLIQKKKYYSPFSIKSFFTLPWRRVSRENANISTTVLPFDFIPFEVCTGGYSAGHSNIYLISIVLQVYPLSQMVVNRIHNLSNQEHSVNWQNLSFLVP